MPLLRDWFIKSICCYSPWAYSEYWSEKFHAPKTAAHFITASTKMLSPRNHITIFAAFAMSVQFSWPNCSKCFLLQLKSFICFNVTTISVLFLICFSKRVATQKFWKLRRQRNRWKWNRAFARARWSTLTPNKKDREHLKRSSLFRGLISAVDNGEDDISLTSQDLMMDTNEDHFWKQGQ